MRHPVSQLPQNPRMLGDEWANSFGEKCNKSTYTFISVSIGGVQSNHTRAVTAVAVASGLKAATVQEHWVDWTDPGKDSSTLPGLACSDPLKSISYLLVIFQDTKKWATSSCPG